MDEIIEEAAREYAEAMCPIGDYCGGAYDEQRNSDLPIYTDNAKSVLEWFFTKPLSQRLTDEEREMVRDTYNEAVEICQNADPMGSRFAFWDARKELIESIFGKELFGEGEG